MKILFVWDSDYPWDIRVDKICNALVENGCEVHLVCRNRLRRPLNETYEGIHIHRISFLSEKYGSWNDMYGFPAFFSPVWLGQISSVAKKYSVDLIIVRDLPMALAACLVGKIRKIPVILDMAECYPEMVRLIWRFEPFKVRNVFVRNPYLVDGIEKLVLRMTDHVFVMIEESMERLLQKGVEPGKITVVSNTPILDKFAKANPIFPGLMRKHRGKLLLLYVGFLNFSRGLDTVIESLPRYIARDKNLFLVLLGTGTAEAHLKQMAHELSVSEYVGFEGWVDHKVVPDYIASADICLVPHHKCGHWDHTIPNKLFDYMAAGKPVSVSDVKPMARIVRSTNSGLVYRDKDPKNFLETLVQLKDKGVRKMLGENGVKAVRDRYNWHHDSSLMVEIIRKRFMAKA